MIRRLPPSLTESSFLRVVSPLPDHDYLYFVAADLSLEPHAFSRAYVNLVNEEDAYDLAERLDGYVFVDEKGGGEYPAMVEFAPYQKVPRWDQSVL